MAAPLDAAPLPRRAPGRSPSPAPRELLKAADLIRDAINPVALAGNGVVRAGAAPALREFVPRDRHPGGRDVHGQGPARLRGPARRSAPSGLQSRDYAMAGFEDADVVIAIGYDLVEHAPEHWNPQRDKKIVVHRLARRPRSTSTSCPRSS